MRLLRGLQLSFRWLRRHSSEERDLTDELKDHLARETEKLMAGGLSFEAARLAALRDIAGIEQLKEKCRDARRMSFIDSWLQDSRYGMRKLGQSPAFSLAVVLTLALGIGANTAIFSLIDAVLWKTLPVRAPRELVLFGTADGNFGGDLAQVGAWGAYSFPLYERFKAGNVYFQDLCAFQSYTSRVNLRIAGAPAHVALGKVVTGNYFSVLGVHPYAGRMLNDADDPSGKGSDVAVVSYRAWVRLFSGDAKWIGRPVDLNGRSITIIGVTPPEFFGETLEPEPADLWLPLRLQPLTMLQSSYLGVADMHWLNIMGRLKRPGDLSAAQAQLTHMLQMTLLAHAGPDISAETKRLISTCRVHLAPGGEGISKLRRRFSHPLRVLMAIVSLILLLACVNIANLLIARTALRQKEISMRLVLGASRYRLIRQLLTESALLAMLGGAIGVLISSAGTKVLLRLLSQNGNAYPLDASPGGSVLAFTACLAILATFLFGLAPAQRSTKLDLARSLAGGKAGARVGAAELLVAGQLALSVLLVTTAALLIRSFNNLENQNLGFNPYHVLTVQFDPRLAGYTSERLAALNREIVRRVEALPGVDSAGLAKNSLLGSDIMGGDISVAGYVPRPGENMEIQVNMVTPSYFETEGIQLLRGRGVAWEDAGRQPTAAVVNETMARRFFPNQDAIGKRFAFGSPEEIVGVVKDARYNTLKGDTPAMAYFLLTHYSATDLEVRTRSDPASVMGGIRRAVGQIDANIPILSIAPLQQRVEESASQEHLVADVAGFFGIVSLILASVGVYGIVNSAVRRRQKEIGIRIAIGAEPMNVAWAMMGQSLAFVLIGVGIGCAVGFYTHRLITAELYGVTPNDPLTIGAAIAVLIVVAFCSALIPMRRAARVDPMQTLRYE